MEKTLFNWYEDLKKKNVPVTPKMIKKKALEITKFKDFIASKGWLEKFKRKYRLELSRETKNENNTSNVIFNSVNTKKTSQSSQSSSLENIKQNTVFINTNTLKPFHTIEVCSKTN